MTGSAMPARPELYVSTDIEADGPAPGPHSMLSFASAVFDRDKNLLDTFSANLRCLPGAEAHPATAAWWQTQHAAWVLCRQDPDAPAAAMARYRDWLHAIPGRPVFVGYPAAFDFMFIAWYLLRFTGENPFGFSAIDIKTYAMAVLGREYRHTVKHRMPEAWFDDLPHTHVALDDAIEQGALFCNILRHAERGGGC